MKTITAKINDYHEYQELLKQLESDKRWSYIHVESRNLVYDLSRYVFDYAIVQYQC